MSAPTTRPALIPPPSGVPEEVARNWARLSWDARRRWTARVVRDQEQARAERQARYKATTAPRAPGAKRPTAETTRLVRQLTADGLIASEIVARLAVTASAVESALRKQGAAAELQRPYRRLAQKERDAYRDAMASPQQAGGGA